MMQTDQIKPVSAQSAEGGGVANEKKRQGGRSALPKVCLEVLAIGQLPRKETVAGPPSGHPALLKPSSRLASLRIVVLSQDGAPR